MSNQTLDRIAANAQGLIDQYDKATTLLSVAIKEAMPWAMPAVMNGSVPKVDQLERLCTQLLAIVLASQPSSSEPPKPARVMRMTG